MKNIKFSIVGYGGIAKTHLLGAFDANISCELPFHLLPVATVTRKEDEVLQYLGIENYNSFEQMCNDSKPDFVDICTPNNTHLSYVKEAIEQGVPIYCEKPLTENMESAIELENAVKNSTVPFACAFIYRMLPCVNMLKEMIMQGVIGNVISFKTALFHSGYLSMSKGGWRVSSESGGGAMLDLGIHLVDTVQYIFGDIESIKAKTHIQFPNRSKVDEHAFCEVKLCSGIEGTIEVSRIMAQTYNSDYFEIYGEKGSLVVDMKKPHTVQFCDADTGNTSYIGAEETLLKKLHYPNARGFLGFLQSAHTASLIEFASSVNSGEKSTILADIDDAMKAQKIVMDCYNTNMS